MDTLKNMFSFNDFQKYRDKQYEEYQKQWENLKYCSECDKPFKEAGNYCSSACFEASLI